MLSRFLKDRKLNEDEALDIEFAAMVLNVTTRTVKRHMVSGKIVPLIHFGKTLRFSRKALAAN